MIKIEEGKSFEIHNLLSFRKKMTQSKVTQAMLKIQQFLKENDLKKNGPLIHTTFSIEVKDGEHLLDMEFLFPIDKEFKNTKEYKFKEIFRLENAVYTRHMGNRTNIQHTYLKVNKYVQENNLQPIASAYNVNVREINNPQEINNMVVDVYLPVSPCIL